MSELEHVTAEEMLDALKERLRGRRGMKYGIEAQAREPKLATGVVAIPVEAMRGELAERIIGRSDIGFQKAGADLMLEPRNPFEPEMRRRLRKEVVVFGALVLLLLGSFAYFNFS